MNKNLQKLQSLGQSIWYDNLSKDILDSGELKSLIAEGITGLTSNPAIFKKAIADTDTYDQKIKALASEHDTMAITEQLMLEDVAAAADLLRPIYDQTDSKDGYASLEVSPLLADKTAETVEAAKRYWNALNRPNIMIKVPATPEGIPAIKELIAAGINVNVTLIFSPAMYAKVVQAYQAGLRERIAAGGDIKKIHSVASFFISRNDAWAEKNNKETNASFLNQIGISNAMLAYDIFREQFSAENFSDLGEKGGNFQRVLWASTGVKNPSLDTIYYAVNLPFEHTVATHPPALIEALMNNEIPEQLPAQICDNPQAHFDAMQSTGLKATDMYDELLSAGVSSFAGAFDELLAAVSQKSNQ